METIVKKIMDFAEAKSKTDNPFFCLNELLKSPQFKDAKMQNISGRMTDITENGGLVREQRTCDLDWRPIWHYKFNKKMETKPKRLPRGEATNNILNFAKDKAETKEGWFCSHDLMNFLKIPIPTATKLLFELEKKGRLTELFEKYTCKFSDRKHKFYQLGKQTKIPKEVKPKKHRTAMKKQMFVLPIQSEEPYKMKEQIEVPEVFKKIEFIFENGKITFRVEK